MAMDKDDLLEYLAEYVSIDEEVYEKETKNLSESEKEKYYTVKEKEGESPDYYKIVYPDENEINTALLYRLCKKQERNEELLKKISKSQHTATLFIKSIEKSIKIYFAIITVGAIIFALAQASGQ